MTVQCSGNGVETCDMTGNWGAPVACQNMTCVNGKCTGVCAQGATLCSNNGVETCSTSGMWGTAVACTNSTCVNGSCTGMCAPMQTQCSGNTPQTCNANGGWTSASACSNQTCVGGMCSGVCGPGQTQCLGQAIQSCDSSGGWTTQTTCSAPMPACLNSSCVACSPTTKQCGSGNGVETCSDAGSWGPPVACTNQTCVGGVCSGTCAPGQTTCSGNTPQSCNGSGGWASGTPCTSAPCVGGACATPITLVQAPHASTTASGASLSLTFTQANTAGDLIVLAVGWTDTTMSVTSVADTAGNTYTKAIGPNIYSPDLSQLIYYAAGIKAAAAGNKITVTMSAAANSLDLRAAEFGGLSTSAPLDKTAGASGKSLAASSGAATTTSPYELLFGAGMSNDLFSSAGAGFTLLAVTPNGNMFEYEIVQAAGSYAATASQSLSTDEYVMQLATFQ
jgi:hypothetical protein